MEKLINPYIGKPGYNCFGCSPENSHGLKLDFEYRNSSVIAEWKPEHYFAGYENVLHGGIHAALADETAAWLIMVELDTAGMTSSLSVKFLHPVYVTDRKITVCASVSGFSGRKADTMVTISDGDGKICSISKIEYTLFPAELARKKLHFPGREAFIKP